MRPWPTGPQVLADNSDAPFRHSNGESGPDATHPCQAAIQRLLDEPFRNGSALTRFVMSSRPRHGTPPGRCAGMRAEVQAHSGSVRGVWITHVASAVAVSGKEGLPFLEEPPKALRESGAPTCSFPMTGCKRFWMALSLSGPTAGCKPLPQFQPASLKSQDTASSESF